MLHLIAEKAEQSVQATDDWVAPEVLDSLGRDVGLDQRARGVLDGPKLLENVGALLVDLRPGVRRRGVGIEANLPKGEGEREDSLRPLEQGNSSPGRDCRFGPGPRSPPRRGLTADEVIASRAHARTPSVSR